MKLDDLIYRLIFLIQKKTENSIQPFQNKILFSTSQSAYELFLFDQLKL